MQRVLVIGCGGSGKSALARALARKLGLPLVHLDREYWRPGWVEPATDEWEARVRELCAAEEWAIDGNYGGTMELRLARADTAIFLDLPTSACLSGVLRRFARWRGGTRPDLPEGCPETIDLEFLRYVLRYRRTRRPVVLERLARFDGEVVVLTSRRAARRYAETAGMIYMAHPAADYDRLLCRSPPGWSRAMGDRRSEGRTHASPEPTPAICRLSLRRA